MVTIISWTIMKIIIRTATIGHRVIRGIQSLVRLNPEFFVRNDLIYGDLFYLCLQIWLNYSILGLNLLYFVINM
jgi:hypothetical protein